MVIIDTEYIFNMENNGQVNRDELRIVQAVAGRRGGENETE